jgi:hypothetical protein
VEAADGPCVSELLVESSDREQPAQFEDPTADLVSFISFVVAERYGSTHPLSLLAARLRRGKRVDLGPFWEFYDANPEDDEDRAHLERIWQPAAALAACAGTCAALLRTDAELAAYAEGFPLLPELLEDLSTYAAEAAKRDARVRMTYRL